MKRFMLPIGVWLCVLASLAFVLGAVGVRTAAAQPPDFELKYHEDFETDQLEGWTTSGCEIVPMEASRALRCATPTNPNRLAQFSGVALLEEQQLGNEPFFLRYRFRTGFGVLNTNLMLSQTNEQISRYFARLAAGEGSLQMDLYRQAPGGEPELVARTDTVQFSPEVWYEAEFSFQDGFFVVRILLNGDPVLVVRFRDEQPLAAGQFAFEIGSGEIFVDDFEIWQPQEMYTFSGRVFAGEPGDRSMPMPGFTVALFGANSPHPDPGEQLAEIQTNADGYFELSAPSGYEFYAIRLFIPPGFEPIDARSRLGTVQDPDWIELPAPLENPQADGNEFYVRPVPPEPYVFSGRVFMGEPGDRSAPQAGFTVAVFGANSPHPDPGEILDETQTNADGFYELVAPAGYEFYSVRVFLPEGFEPIEADSQGGTMQDPDWIEYAAPLADQQAAGSEFFVRPIEPVAPATLTPPPAPTRTPLPPIVTPTPECLLGVICGPTDWLVLVLGGLLLGGIILGGGLLFFRGPGPGDPSSPGKLLPPTPGLPPIRLANAWLSQGPGGQGKPLRPDVTLAAGGMYTLHVQIQPRQLPPRDGTDRTRSYPLDVVFFFLDGDFAPPTTRRVTIALPSDGPSQEVRLNLQPQHLGQRRVRVGIYHNNVLLQSLYVDMQVAKKSRKLSGAIQRSIDYVASARFLDLETLGTPRLNLFTNETADGDRWIGLFSNTGDSPVWLQQGAVHQFSTATLAARALDARSALAKVAGERIYRLDYRLPMDAETLAVRSNDLIALAQTGYELFTTLFTGAARNRADKAYLRDLAQHLSQTSGIISIARCREDSTSFPWSALYSHYLSDEQPAQLCPVFKEWLARQGEAAAPEPGEDLLQDPQACRARPDCPLGGEAADHTVCPFGFWGFMHQVEQPLQLVSPVPVNTVPEEVKDPEYEATSRIELVTGERVRMGMGVYAGFQDLAEHEANLRRLADPTVLELAITDDPTQVSTMLAAGGRHLLYLFCHGHAEGKVFTLEVGTPEHARRIKASGLDWMHIDWPAQPQTLVFLNGCESMALTPELVHGFLEVLRFLGASGVVGVEINNWSQFAAPFAEKLLDQVLDRQPFGEALLATRRDFLRRGNPLGLVYSLHGPAQLHLHAQAGCPHCAALAAAGAAARAGAV
jgi:hypothetical protein